MKSPNLFVRTRPLAVCALIPLLSLICSEASGQTCSSGDVRVLFQSGDAKTRIKGGVGGYISGTNIYRLKTQTRIDSQTAENPPTYGGSFNQTVTIVTTWPTNNYTLEPGSPGDDGCYFVQGTNTYEGTASFNGSCGAYNGSCSTAMDSSGAWTNTSCLTLANDWYVCASASWGVQWQGTGDQYTETTFTNIAYYSNAPNRLYRITQVTELANIYPTSELIARVRADAIAASYPGAWGESAAGACLSLATTERCATANKMKVAFAIHAIDTDRNYKISWDEVTTVTATGNSFRVGRQAVILGTGGWVTNEHEYLPPTEPGCISIENVRLWDNRKNPNVAGSGGSSFTSASSEGGCQGCAQIASEARYDLSGAASFELELGKAAFGARAGTLAMYAGLPSTNLATPAILEYNSVRPDVEVVRPSGGDIRQVKAPQALADVIATNAWQFAVRFFLPSQVGSPDGQGIYALSGSPYVVWTIENPDTTNAFNKWKITESRDGTLRTNLYEYTSATRTWKLTSPANLREDELKIENDTNAAVRTETSWARKPGGSDLQKVIRLFKKFSWGEGLVAEHVGDTNPQITTNIYTSNGSANGTRLPLEKTIFPTGAFEKHQYDQYGRLTNTVSQFLGYLESAGENYHRVTAFSYAAVGGSSGDDITIQSNTVRTTIFKLRGQEIGRHYRIFRSGGEELDIACPTPGAAWDASDNLLTVTKHFTSGANSNRVSSIKRPDGTMTFFDYTETTTNRTTTETTGQPDVYESAILNGTETVTVINAVGEMVSRTVRAIVSGSTATMLSKEIYSDYDQFSRPRKVTYLDGSFTWTDHGVCCGTTSETNRDGALIEYFRDDLNRTVATKTLGITTSNILDAANRVLAVVRKGTDNSLITTRSTAYDQAGRMTFETNALGGVTSITEGFDTGLPVKTNIYADGGVTIETLFIDGQLKTVTGSATYPSRYDHGIESDGGAWREYSTEIKLNSDGTDSSEWTKTLFDGAGRAYKTVFAGSGTPYKQSYFNNLGQLWKERDPDGVITLRAYNVLGERAFTALDSNRNDVIDFSGLDRITQNTNDVTTHSGVHVQRTRTYVWETPGSSTSTLLSTIEVSTNGLTTWRTGPNGTSSIAISAPPWASKTITETAPDNSYTISLYQTGRLVSVTRYDSGDNPIGETTYGYDFHGRQNTITDVRNGTTSYTFNNADQVVSVTTPPPGTGQPAQTTSTYYNKMLQATNIVEPDGGSVKNEYFETGLLKKTSGNRKYTVAYTYESQGRLKTQTTWTNTVSGNGTVTTWNYDERGFLTNKAYADNMAPGPDYTYTAAGKLATRTWARGNPRISTTYTYNNAGDLATVDYSDATLDLTYGCDRRGRPSSIVQGSSVYTTTLTFNLAGQVISESFNGQGVTNAYDSLLRRTAVGLSGQSATTVNYRYDGASRLAGVTNGVNTASYTYVANSPLVSQLIFKNNGTTRMTTTKSWDKLNRLFSITSVAGTTVASIYHYNSANRRTRTILPDASWWVYQYDNLGQVTSGKKYWSDGTPVEGQQFEYAFDDIGNRRSTKTGGDSSGANLRSATYTANNLNQYSSRTVAGYTEVLGAADSRSTVTVNTASTYRKGEYFRKELTVSNGSTNIYQSLTNTATWGSTNETVIGNIFVPKTPEAFYYDADGNLTNDGRWFYSWDAENRLTQMIATNVVDGARRKLTFEYDHKGRRIRKTSYHPNGSGWTVTNDLAFVYDGWNMLAELNATNNAIVRSYFWGSDLGGSVQGTGGVGGLLAVNDGAQGLHFTAYDGNGNIVALVNGSDGTVSATYEYGPFGELIRATGPIAKANPFRFSTKYQDIETDLLYYGYRYYSASTGRWLSRDPIAETGGQNLYNFARNRSLNSIDLLGLEESPPWYPYPYPTSPLPPRPCTWCKCVSVSVIYDPGGQNLVLDWYTYRWTERFGNQVHVKWKVLGNPNMCRYYQDEQGTIATMTQTSPVTATGTTLGKNDNPMPQIYTDYLGKAFTTPDDDGSYTLDIKWEVTFRCVSTPSSFGTVRRHDSLTASANFTVPH